MTEHAVHARCQESLLDHLLPRFDVRQIHEAWVPAAAPLAGRGLQPGAQSLPPIIFAMGEPVAIEELLQATDGEHRLRVWQPLVDSVCPSPALSAEAP